MDALAVRLCNLPREFRRVRTKSIVQLLREYGYFEQHGELTREAIVEVLESDPFLIEDWIGYSADKRTSSGWFLLPNGRVGYLGRERHPTNILLQPVSNDLPSACAEFIIREVEDIRSGAMTREGIKSNDVPPSKGNRPS
jgi:hypothetical protein